MKRLFLSKTSHLMRQAKSQAKSRLDHLEVLKDLANDKKYSDLHLTDSLMAKVKLSSSFVKEFSQIKINLDCKKESLGKRIENNFQQLNILRLLLKNDRIDLGSENIKKIKQIHNQFSQILKGNENSQEDEYKSLKWIRHLILILFLTKIIQQKNIRCEYDINDMMITMQLQQRLLIQEQQNEKHQKQERQKEDREKQENRKKSVSFKGPTKDERYGTVEEMLRHQMESSEDFGSVQQRMMFKQRQQNKTKQMQAKKNTSQSRQAVNQQKQNKNEENIADVVFRQQIKPQKLDKINQQKHIQNVQTNLVIEQVTKNNVGIPDEVVDQYQQQEQKNNIENKDNLEQKAQKQSISVVSQNKTPNEQQSMISQQQNIGSKQSQAIKKMKNHQSSQVDNDVLQGGIKSQEQKKFTQDINTQTNENKTIVNQLVKQSVHEIQNRQNHATLQLPSSQQFLTLSKSIQNFLKLRGIDVTILNGNNKNDQHKNKILLNLCNKLMDCKQITIDKQASQNRDVFHHINNLLNPPHILNSIEQAKQLLKTIEKDENIVGSYIPQHQSYEKSKKPLSQFDTFSSRYPQLDPATAEKRFRQYKYLSSSKKNCFVIVRDKQVANYLKISTSKIGVPHVLYKYDKQLNGKQSEPNCKIDEGFYHVVGNLDRMMEKQGLNTIEKVSQKINQLTQRSFTLINSVEDMYDKIRQLKQQSVSFSFNQQQHKSQQQKINPHKKLFVIKINDPKSQTQINAILEKLSKMNKKEVSIVKTQSQVLLKSLGVFSNQQYGTMRLFDLEHRQQPIVKQNDKYSTKGPYQRYVPNVPFQVEFLSRWISNITPFDKPYEEYDRQVNKLKSSHPGDFETTSQEGKVKLVLFYKQGCKGCKMMQDLLSRIVELKQRLEQNDTESVKRIKREICLRYRIQDPQHLKNLQISKFNILNDDQSIQVPQTTPTIYLFNQTNKQKVVLKTDQIFSHLNRINTNNGQLVQDHMVRDLIEEIQKGNKRFQSVY